MVTGEDRAITMLPYPPQDHVITILCVVDMKLYSRENVPHHQVHRDIAKRLRPRLLDHMLVRNSNVTKGRERHNIDGCSTIKECPLKLHSIYEDVTYNYEDVTYNGLLWEKGYF